MIYKGGILLDNSIMEQYHTIAQLFLKQGGEMKKKHAALVLIGLLLLGLNFSLSYAQDAEEAEVSGPSMQKRIETYVQDKDYSSAIQLTTNLLEKNPDCLECYFGLGILYYYSGDYGQAVAFLERSLDQHNRTIESTEYSESSTLAALGIVYSKMKQYKKAEEYFEKATLLLEESGDIKSLFFIEAAREMARELGE